jgi:hypothetical protein
MDNAPDPAAILERRCDAAARWWFSRGGVGVTTFAPMASVVVNGHRLNCGPKIRNLKNLEGAELAAADAAIEARLAVLRAADPSGHDAPWPGLEVLEEVVVVENANEKRYDAAARWWLSRGGVGVTTFAPNCSVKVDGKALFCGRIIRNLKNLEGAELAAADAAIVARLAELRAADPSRHDAPWPGLEVLEEGV